MSCPDKRAEELPELADHPRGTVRNMLGLHPILQREEDLELVPREALGVPVAGKPVQLRERVRASGEAELPVDAEERDREHDPLNAVQTAPTA